MNNYAYTIKFTAPDGSIITCRSSGHISVEEARKDAEEMARKKGWLPENERESDSALPLFVCVALFLVVVLLGISVNVFACNTHDLSETAPLKAAPAAAPPPRVVYAFPSMGVVEVCERRDVTNEAQPALAWRCTLDGTPFLCSHPPDIGGVCPIQDLSGDPLLLPEPAQ